MGWFQRRHRFDSGIPATIYSALGVSSAAMLAACVPHPVAPVQPQLRAYVEVTLVQPGVPAAYVAGVNAGAAAWTSVGVGIATAKQASLAVCGDAWWTVPPGNPCRIRVNIIFWPKSMLGGFAGLTANHESQLAQELTGNELISVSAHELGHSIWNTPAHLLPGEVGIMSAISTYVTSPSAADLRYVKLHTNGAFP